MRGRVVLLAVLGELGLLREASVFPFRLASVSRAALNPL